MSPSITTREAGTSQQARRPVRRRLSASHVLIGLVVIAAFTLNLLALRQRDETVLVAVAGERLTTGSPLSLSALEFIPVSSSFEALDTLIGEASSEAIEGWFLRRTLEPGDLVELGALEPEGSSYGLRAMSVPVRVEHAAGGTLVIGDHVDVISVDDGASSYVAEDLEVIGLPDGDTTGLGSLREYHILLTVGEEESLAIAAAIDSGSLEIVRATGADPLGGDDT